MRALGALLLLPAACQNQPQAVANAQPTANAVVPAAPPRDDLARARQVVQRQLGNAQGLTFADTSIFGDERVPIVCGKVGRDGRNERFIVVDGRGAWIESEMRPGQMDRAVREFCVGAGRPQGMREGPGA